MNISLKEQLDDLAERAVGDRRLDHPAFVTAPRSEGNRYPAAFALAACFIVGVLIAGAWLLQRPPSDVDTAGQATRQPIPALLLEEPVPLSDLTPELRGHFIDREVRGPLASIDSGLASTTFDGVHVVERGDVTVVVGLDITGSTICLAVQFAGQQGTGSSCRSAAGFMVNSSIFSSHAVGEQSTSVALVPNDVVAIEVGTETAQVTRNIGIHAGPSADALRLVYPGGVTQPAQSIPDPDAEGQLLIDGQSPLDVAAVGCSMIDGRFHAEAAFVDANGLISATITEDGVVLAGGTDGEEVDVVDTNADTEADETGGTLIVTAAWSSDDRSGIVTVDCGDRFLDLSSIR